MNKKEFSQIRHDLGKTQKQMAQLLGTSLKAVQSFEQGWRDIPLPVRTPGTVSYGPEVFSKQKYQTMLGHEAMFREDPAAVPAWEFQAGHLCWFINGTICGGKVQKSWQGKMEICRQCAVFVSLFSPTPGREGGEGNE